MNNIQNIVVIDMLKICLILKKKYMNKILAKKNDSAESIGNTLVNHTKMVINVGLYLGKEYVDFGNDKFDLNNNKLRKDFFEFLSIALLSHDIGKITNNFQESLNNKRSKKSYGIPHEIASYFFLKSCVKCFDNNIDDSILFSVLNHHVYDSSFSVTKKNEIFLEDELEKMKEFFYSMIEYINSAFAPLNIDFSKYSCREKQNKNELPSVNNIFSEITISSNNSYELDMFHDETKLQLIRAILLQSDRLVSSIETNEELQLILDNEEGYIASLIRNYHVINNQKINYDFKSSGYDLERLKMQEDILDDTKGHNHNVISASAGFGKTVIGLMWFLNNKNKIFWVSPRNSLCVNNYESLNRELKKLGIFDKVKVCLVYGGNIQKANDRDDIKDAKITDYDIVVSNIDAVVNRLTHNNIGHLLFNMYSSNIIFDEYHEFVSESGGLFSEFIRLMFIRTRFTYSQTLLLSATPSDLDCLIDKGYVNYINKRNILNENTKYNIKYIHINNAEDIYKENFNFDGNSISIISKTIDQATDLYLSNPNQNKCVLFHSNFTENDKTNKLNRILYENGKNNFPLNERRNVISTNIVGTGLDISFKNMFDFVDSHETTIQRACGRMNRFGEFDEVNYYVCDIDTKFSIYDKKLSKKWIEYLKLYDGKTITRRNLYELYDKFINENKNDITSYYIKCFNGSSKDLIDVKTRTVHNKRNTNGHKPLSFNKNIRGESTSMYVIAKMDNSDEFSSPIIIEDYHLPENEDDYNTERKNYINETYKTEINKYKYAYCGGKINSYSVNDLKEFGKIRPIPLFSVTYNSEIGLHEMDSK